MKRISIAHTAGFTVEESAAAADKAIELITAKFGKAVKNPLGKSTYQEWLSEPVPNVGIRVVKGEPGVSKSGIYLMARAKDRQWYPVPVMWAQRKESELPEVFQKDTISSRGSLEWGVSRSVDIVKAAENFTKQALEILKSVRND